MAERVACSFSSLPRSRFLRPFCAFLAVFALASCGPRPDNSRVNIPPPVESNTVGPGDVFQLQIVGEKDLPEEYQVASDGTATIPYLHSVKVEGLESQMIARVVRERLIQEQILSDPIVIVRIKEYGSKRVTILGAVEKRGSFPLTPGLSLIQLVSLAGGLGSIANGDRVNLIRRVNGKPKTFVVSVRAISDGRSPDIPLQAGDSIYVYDRIF